MNETKLLIGSLSNDLYRVANLLYRGSDVAANRFLQEANRWLEELKNHEVKPYIRKILINIPHEVEEVVDPKERAEKYLMYSVLLQNYALHM